MLHTEPTSYSAQSIKHDKELHIATANSRDASRWRNITITLSELVERLAHTTRTGESVDEYMALPKSEQDNIKDVGGFVGGVLKGGKRGKGNVANRQVLTLDADFAKPDMVEKIKAALGDVAYTVYSTHKHKPESPRLRLVVYPDRPLHADEYQACMRAIAGKVGVDAIDDTTYDVNRLMYWPSSPRDGEFVFMHNDQPMFSVDEMLAEYGPEDAWKDTTLWPRSSRETRDLERMLKKQADPLTKGGAVGAFCRVVSIYDAIETILGESVYRKETTDRYTYAEGSTTKGLVVYDGKFAYSNHGTDPIHGHTCNAFDLVRLHKFGHLDDDAAHGTNSTKLPSYKEMIEFARAMPEVKRELVESKLEIDADEFDIFADDGESISEDHDISEWVGKLQTTDDGDIKTTFVNALMIVENDPRLNERMRLNEMSMVVEKTDTTEMWRAVDSYAVREYIGKRYKADFPELKVEQAIERCAWKNRYHPVRDYLKTLEWDGVERLDKLFVNYLGAVDNAYTRQAASCTLLAGVSRVFEPGTKFDTVPVLGGAQGIGKSTFIRVLCGDEWFGELSSFDPKIAMEEINGKWLVEITELGATSKSDLEHQKAFLSGTATTVRMAYAKHATQFKRQCVFIGTTNQHEYLKDSTGNRRWWPITCAQREIDMDKLRGEVDQIWAEAVERYIMGESLLMDDDAAAIAKVEQEDKREAEPWEGIIAAWLAEDAHEDRYEMNGGFAGDSGPLKKRDRVCVMEIWEDCLGMRGDPKPVDRRRIGHILDAMPDWEKSGVMRFGQRFGRQKGWKPDCPF